MSNNATYVIFIATAVAYITSLMDNDHYINSCDF